MASNFELNMKTLSRKTEGVLMAKHLKNDFFYSVLIDSAYYNYRNI